MPSVSSRALAADVAVALAAAAGDSLQRVSLIGSHATGTANVDSDLDLVAILEVHPSQPVWGRREVTAARDALLRKMPRFSKRIDLSVRTTDRFAEDCLTVLD